MKILNALFCCLTIAFAPMAAAQAQKPPAKGAAPAKDVVRMGVELKQNPRQESCQKQASEKKLSGQALETFLSSCLK